MAARRVTWTVILLLLGVLCGCAAPIEGTARAGAPPAPASSSASPSSAAPPGPDLRTGQCVGGADLTPIDCARPHTVEIIAAGRFDASLPGARPADATVYQAALPACRVETGSYLGNGQYDASTIGAYLLWPGPQEWVAGQRWYFCGVAQLAADGTPVTRDGTARGALAGDSLYAAQLCSSARPQYAVVVRTACDGPHAAEAIGTVPMGDPTAPVPGDDAFSAAAGAGCAQALAAYLGVPRRPDVLAAWRWPSAQEWRLGFTDITCFAQPEVAVSRPLRGLGSAPLPR
jgi:hypothetical protein